MAYRENIVLRSSEKRESAEIVDENSVKYLSQTLNIKRCNKSEKTSQSSSEDSNDDDDPLFRIVVRRGSTYFLDQRFYRMSSKVRGHVLIINNEKFSVKDIYPFRKGSSVDIDNLTKLFEQMGFIVETHENLKRNETFKKLIDFSEKESHISAEMAIICVSSHGSLNGKVISADSLEIDLENDILRFLDTHECFF